MNAIRVYWFLLLALMVSVSRVRGDLRPPEGSYKILMLLPFSSESHRNVFIPLAEALADRGHEIIMLSSTSKPYQHPGIHEMSHNLPDFSVDDMDVFKARREPDGVFSLLRDMLPRVSRKIYQVPVVKDLYSRRKEFDLIVTDHMFAEMMYPFAHEMPFITVATPGMDPRQSAVFGNPLSPAYVPSLVNPPDLSTVFGRLMNVIMHIVFAVYWRNWTVVPAIQREITLQFPDLPPLLEIERNQSLSLLNSHFSMGMALPLLPSQVEVGGMHCRSARPLPEDIKSWIEGAGSAGVIYFSLGSIAKGETMPVEYRDMFLQAFKKVDQRIIWKFETELEGVSENVLIRKWMPQQDILAHPNVKMFITHGGLLSLQESLCHGTPMVALPIFGDQPSNGDKIVAGGVGLSLIWEELTVDMIVESIKEIIQNPKYIENAAEISRLFQDQLNPPVERAVFWTEYVIRHQGAPKLRSRAARLSWVEFLLLDALALLLLIVVITLLLVRWVFRRIVQCLFSKSNNKRKRKQH